MTAPDAAILCVDDEPMILASLREQEHPGIVTMMLTGQADEAAIERARQHANLHACLHKPWSEEELIRTVASALP